MPRLPHSQPRQTCSAFCLSAWWSVAVPQACHQGRGFHTGLAAAVPDCIPVAQPEEFLSVYKAYNPDGGLHSVATSKQCPGSQGPPERAAVTHLLHLLGLLQNKNGMSTLPQRAGADFQ